MKYVQRKPVGKGIEWRIDQGTSTDRETRHLNRGKSFGPVITTIKDQKLCTVNIYRTVHSDVQEEPSQLMPESNPQSTYLQADVQHLTKRSCLCYNIITCDYLLFTMCSDSPPSRWAATQACTSNIPSTRS